MVHRIEGSPPSQSSFGPPSRKRARNAPIVVRHAADIGTQSPIDVTNLQMNHGEAPTTSTTENVQKLIDDTSMSVESLLNAPKRGKTKALPPHSLSNYLLNSSSGKAEASYVCYFPS